MKRTPLLTRLVAASTALASTLALGACVGPPASHWAKKVESTCPFAPDESITTTAKLGYQAIPMGNLIVLDKGVLEACMPNATITWSRFDSGADVIQGFGSGSVDLGVLGSSSVLQAASKPLSMDIVVPWVFDVIGDAESLVVKDPHVTTVKQLKGKTIAVPYGSTSHYSLLQALKDAGLDATTDVHIVNLAPDKMVSAWTTSQVDAAWVWDPTLTKLTAQGHIIYSSAQTAAAGAGTYDMAAATRTFAQDNPEFLRMWARAQDWAAEQIATNPDDAADSVAAQLGIDKETVLKQFKGYEYPRARAQASPELLGGKLGDGFIKTSVFLRDQQLISAVADDTVYRGLLYPQPASQAAPATEGN